MARVRDPKKERVYNRRAYAKRKAKTSGRLYQRRSFLKKTYGLSLEDYDRMHRACGGLCQICRRPETAKHGNKLRVLCVDHDHETKIVRGLLCSSCNRGLGYLGDEALRLRAAVQYLEGYGVHQKS